MPPLHADFVFVRHPAYDATTLATTLATALRERAVLVRHFREPRIDQYLRISIGTRAQCTRLVAAFENILQH